MNHHFLKQMNREFTCDVFTEMIGTIQKISIKGTLIYGNTRQAREKLQAITQPADGCMIDISHLTFIDSTGFGVLINYAKQNSLADHPFPLIVSDNVVKEMLIISRLHQIFPLVSNQEEAIRLLTQ